MCPPENLVLTIEDGDTDIDLQWDFPDPNCDGGQGGDDGGDAGGEGCPAKISRGQAGHRGASDHSDEFRRHLGRLRQQDNRRRIPQLDRCSQKLGPRNRFDPAGSSAKRQTPL